MLSETGKIMEVKGFRYERHRLYNSTSRKYCKWKSHRERWQIKGYWAFMGGRNRDLLPDE